jgi:hypothetical protein
MWSSAMVIAPLLRGLFGVSCDFPNKAIHVNPHLPAEWDHARLRNVALGSITVDLAFDRNRAGKLTVRAVTPQNESFCLVKDMSATCKVVTASVHMLTIDEPPVQLGILTSLPEPGSETRQLKVLDEQYSQRQVVFRFAARAQSAYDLPVRLNRSHIAVAGGEVAGGKLHLQFPNGEGYQSKSVTFSW